MDFDLDNLVPASAPVWFPLLHPKTGVAMTRNGAAVEVAILGPDTQRMIDFEAAAVQKRLAEARATGEPNISAQAFEAEANERAVMALADWKNFGKGGADLPFSGAAAKEAVTELRWLRDFIEARYRNRGNFLGA